MGSQAGNGSEGTDGRIPAAVPQHANQELDIQKLLSYLPVMPTTVLALEFLLQEHSVNLRSVAELVTHDLGAAACVLRSCADDESDARPQRMVDAISRFEMRDLLDLLASHMN